MTKIDKEALIAALRNSTQNPRAVEVVIQQLEAGDFDADKTPARAPLPPVETAIMPDEDVELREERGGRGRRARARD